MLWTRCCSMWGFWAFMTFISIQCTCKLMATILFRFSHSHTRKISAAHSQKTLPNNKCQLLCKSRYDCSSPFIILLVGSALRCTCLSGQRTLYRWGFFPMKIMSRIFVDCRCSNILGSGIAGRSIRLWTAPCKIMIRKMLHLLSIVLFQHWQVQNCPCSSRPSGPQAIRHERFLGNSCIRLSRRVCMIYELGFFKFDAWLGNIICNKFDCYHIRCMRRGLWGDLLDRDGCSLLFVWKIMKLRLFIDNKYL